MKRPPRPDPDLKPKDPVPNKERDAFYERYLKDLKDNPPKERK